MKLVILAGGLGTRLGSITEKIPKPMVSIGNRPIIWHIMKYYFDYGIRDFILCLGYKCESFISFFQSQENKSDILISQSNIELIDTGLNTLKGGRIKKIEKYLDDNTNLLTYGDGLSNVNIESLIEFHSSHTGIVTVTGVHPPSRFGELEIKNNLVTSFVEKAQLSRGYINGGFMVFDKTLMDYLTDEDDCDFEHNTLEELSHNKKVFVFKHESHWECMDNERELNRLNEMYNKGEAFWTK